MAVRLATLCPGRRRQACAWLVVALLAALAAPADADRLVLTDGRSYEGKVITQTKSTIRFEIDLGNGKKKERLFTLVDVAEITGGDGNKLAIREQAAPLQQPAATSATQPGPSPSPAPAPSIAVALKPATAAPASAVRPANAAAGTACVIPIRHTFGVEINAAIIQKCLEQAKADKADVIILEITSDGGAVGEMMAIMNMFVQWQQHESIPLVAFVREKAFSAAAITALCVKDVYMAPGSTMGAALIISVGADGSIQSLDSTREGEKFSSAIRATARTSAEAAGQNPLIVEAMIDPDVALCVATDHEGKRVILKGRPSDYKAIDFSVPPREVVARGKLLTLTTNEAVDLGVARAMVKDLDELSVALNREGWTIDDAATRIVDAHEKEIEKNLTAYSKMLDRINAALSKIRTSSSRELANVETSLNTARVSVQQIERMAKEYPYIAERVMMDFPFGIERERAAIELAIGQVKEYRALQRRQ